jgi:D-serine deaminase-like pyridoxal phosphate-dependent protein
MELAKRVTISVTADSAVVIRGLSESAQRTGLTLTVLIECDTGLHRCGVQSPQEAVELARLIKELPNLHFGGLMTYPTSDQTDIFVRETRALIAKMACRSKGSAVAAHQRCGRYTNILKSLSIARASMSMEIASRSVQAQ